MSKRIMVCLDGSNNSLRGLEKAISFAKEFDAMIIGVHSDTSFSAFSAVRAPTLPRIENNMINESIITVIFGICGFYDESHLHGYIHLQHVCVWNDYAL